ncbi:Chondroitin synthase [Paenibacillus sp. P1XP2]|nr:Chondroitin synthase [Paenibacillus sp. P1XP2]
MNFFVRVYYFLLKYLIRIKIKFNYYYIVRFGLNWYKRWIAENELVSTSEGRDSGLDLKYRPLISVILPVYNVEEDLIKECIDSVLSQTYPNWELCIADDNSSYPHIKKILKEYQIKDSRIKVVFRQINGHISACSNSALELVVGEFTALLDHDDILSTNALFEVVKEINRSPNADIIFSNEDKIYDNQRREPFFKKNWDINLLYSMNFMCHLTIYRTSLIKKVGGFRVGFEGVQDWDLAIRASRLAREVKHIPKILYHWRITNNSTSSGEKRKPYIKNNKRKMIEELYKNI